ncbi:hypothetical protein CALCODRAFT_501096 [Calocera cornea HHB12733]|uniref:D-aminoacyl-tRNA deacylase n=1 Tax=Calocera cornea HHB12733 TaxID=1353952 RepID=A0A165DT65_9BASI|nr:hypothetical protein CALCODRAFT_501096 [Calocera cornea HHB12733]
MWKRSVLDIQGEILCVSQFTLLASTLKGTKPDFHGAMPPLLSEPFYTAFLASLRAAYTAAAAAAAAPARPGAAVRGAGEGGASGERVKDGRFGAHMSVALTNEGPVTITLDSRRWEYVARPARAEGRGKGASGSSTPAEGGRKGRGRGRSGAGTPAEGTAATPAPAPPAEAGAGAGEQEQGQEQGQEQEQEVHPVPATARAPLIARTAAALEVAPPGKGPQVPE